MNLVSGTYTSVVIVLDVVGNGFVVFATVAHNAIKLDKMSVWIIQNLAVVDMANAVFVLTPSTISYFADGTWVLGTAMCKLTFAYKYSFVIGNIFLINLLSVNKLIRCLFPLRNLVSSRRQRHLVTCFIVLIMLAGPARKLPAVFITESALVRFSQIHGTCIAYVLDMGVEKHFHPELERAMSILFTILPCLALVILNATLVGFAVRSVNRKVNRKNVLIVVLVTLTFVLTYTPFGVQYQIYGQSFHNAPPSLRIGLCLGFISSFSNPFIYMATNDTFKEFTKSTARWIFCEFTAKAWTRLCRGLRKISSC